MEGIVVVEKKRRTQAPGSMPAEWPEQGEFVLATVKKVMPFGAVCALDEYKNMESFMHISEVASGWIRNIREHIKEGQKVVALVLAVNREKGHVDLSAKRVSEVEKKRKMESYKSSLRAERIIERAAASLKKKEALEEARGIHDALVKKWGDAWTGLQAIARGEDAKIKLAKEWQDALLKIAAEELKPKEVKIRTSLTLKSYAGDGMERVKSILASIEAAGGEAAGVEVHYLGAPHYYVDVSAADYLTAEKVLSAINAKLEVMQREKGVEWSLEKVKEAS